MKNIVYLMLIFIINQSIQSQTNSTNNLNSDYEISNRVYTTLSAGIHWGDGRLIAKPIIFLGLGYYLTNGLSLKIEYTPVVVKAKNNSYPLFRYKGKELQKGDEVTIEEYFCSLEGKIFNNVWLDFGIAPENLFSMKIGLKYNYHFNENILIFGEYSLLLVGQKLTYNFKGDVFTNSSILIGLNNLFF
ncbi:MAG: hypothetical protein A2V93_01425 [Ignavibacteria bacterium RBG_16_34_14]|nr:MAG: hypothetical protein A2V93_01425 [Ignavibacteria bacterium RBG_16_34_14]